MNIPFTDLKLLHSKIRDEIDEVIADCIDNNAFIMGKYVTKFENNMKNFLNSKFAFGVSSGTDAILIPLMAMGIKPGDEIITTPFTFIATAEVITLLGAKPVFVDIDEKTYNINPDLIEKKITNKTKCIIPVHLYGHPAEMNKINEIAKNNNLKIVEDSCQAIGAKYYDEYVCNIGDAGSLSFFPSKNLGGFGDGGMVITNDPELAEKIDLIRVHGSKKRYWHEVIGVNGRLDNLQAAVLDVKLKKLSEWIDQRINAAKYYIDKLAVTEKIICPVIKDDCKHVFNQFTIRVKNRENLQNKLNEKGIPTAIHYPIPLHLQPAFSFLNYAKGSLPIAETISEEVISLPIFPGITQEQQDYIINNILNIIDE